MVTDKWSMNISLISKWNIKNRSEPQKRFMQNGDYAS